MTAVAGAVSSFAAAGSASTNNVTPGVLGFLVVAGIGVALVFLFRSMNKQFRKITPEPEVGDGGVGDGGVGDGGVGGSEPVGDAAKVSASAPNGAARVVGPHPADNPTD